MSPSALPPPIVMVVNPPVSPIAPPTVKFPVPAFRTRASVLELVLIFPSICKVPAADADPKLVSIVVVPLVLRTRSPKSNVRSSPLVWICGEAPVNRIVPPDLAS